MSYLASRQSHIPENQPPRRTNRVALSILAIALTMGALAVVSAIIFGWI